MSGRWAQAPSPNLSFSKAEPRRVGGEARNGKLPTVSPNPPVKVEGEDVLFYQLLFHQVVKDRQHVVDRDAGISQAQDAIKLGRNKDDTWLLGGLSKGLLTDFDTGVG